MDTPTMLTPPAAPSAVTEAPSAGFGPNDRGGRIDIDEPLSMFDEAIEESFPASDPPCFTQAGVSNGPPPRK